MDHTRRNLCFHGHIRHVRRQTKTSFSRSCSTTGKILDKFKVFEKQTNVHISLGFCIRNPSGTMWRLKVKFHSKLNFKQLFPRTNYFNQCHHIFEEEIWNTNEWYDNVKVFSKYLPKGELVECSTDVCVAN